MNTITDNLDDLRKFKKVLLLYSGGVDSSFALLYCLNNDIDVLAFRGVDRYNETSEKIKQFLTKLGVKLIEKDYSGELVDHFISKGISAGGFYQNRFPISSSYTRPLIAKYAAISAIEEGCDCIIHTSNFHQNSAARFNNSVMYHSPNMAIAIPYIKSSITRQEKLFALQKAGYEIDGNIYSIDKNIWCRVIENGDLDSIQTLVDEPHFDWTRQNQPVNKKVISIGFTSGLPTSIDNKEYLLIEIIDRLNNLGSRYQIGRFNGLEDTPLGVKNHEVREAPAAEIIFKAKSFLESVILTQDELRLKSELDYRWCELVVNGKWYSLEKDSIEQAIATFNKPQTGTVQIELANKSVFPLAVNTSIALDFNSLETEIAKSKSTFSYSEYYHINSIYNKIRFHNNKN